MLVPAEFLLFLILVTVLVGLALGAFLLRPVGGFPWLPAWGVGLVGAICFLVDEGQPGLEPLGHAAAALYPVLFIVGALLYARRPVARFWIPLGLALAMTRAGLFLAGPTNSVFWLQLAANPAAFLLSAWIVHRHVQQHQETLAHRLIAPGFLAFALLEVVDAPVNMMGGDPNLLWPGWIVTGTLLAVAQLIAMFERSSRERATAVGELAENEQRFQKIGESAFDLILEFDMDERLMYASPGVEPVLGVTPEALIGESWRDWLHPDDVPVVEETVRDLETRSSVRPAPVRVRCEDDTWRWVEATVRLYRRRDGSVRALLVARDVTEQQEAEEALRDTQERLRAILASMGPLRVVLLDENGRVITIFGPSPERREVEYGIDRDEATRRSVHDFLPGDESTRLIERIQRVYKTGEPTEFVQRVELPNGAFTFASSLHPVHGATGDVETVLAVVKDVTRELADAEERRRLEARAERAVRLESLELLAGGIAHDFNNLLMAIQGNSELALDRVPADDALRPLLEDMEQASERAASLTRQLLAYSGQTPRRSTSIDLAALVREAAETQRSSLPGGAQLEVDSGLPCWVRGDGDALEQVLISLLSNAAESFGSGSGAIHVRTGVTQVDDERLAHCVLNGDLPAGVYAFIEVQDDGRGIEPDQIERIFDPFFSSGPVGRGLGLAQVLGIARSHRGTIEVESAPGSGSTFRFLVPSSSGVTLPEEPPLPRPGFSRGGTLLVIDDQDIVRTVAERLLRELGFEVLSVEGGDEAIALFRERGDEIVCVLLDLTMPGLSGEQTLDALRRLRPSLPVVLMSGYGEQQLSVPVESRSGVASLAKPFRQTALASAIRQVLDR